VTVFLSCAGILSLLDWSNKPKQAIQAPRAGQPDRLDRVIEDADKDMAEAVERANRQWAIWAIVDSLIFGIMGLAAVYFAFRYRWFRHLHQDD